MSVNLQQLADGGLKFFDDRAGKDVGHTGGPVSANNTVQPYYQLERWAKVNIGASITNSGGGLMIWTNREGTAVAITRAYISVVATAAQAGTVSMGQATSSTAVSANLITGANVATGQGTIVGDSLGTAGAGTSNIDVIVAPNQYVTLSTSTGSSAGLSANVYFSYILT